MSDFLEKFIDFLREQFVPEDVFTEDQLSEWASENGWVKSVDTEETSPPDGIPEGS